MPEVALTGKYTHSLETAHMLSEFFEARHYLGAWLQGQSGVVPVMSCLPQLLPVFILPGPLEF